MKHFELVLRIAQSHFNTPEKVAELIEFCLKSSITEVQLVPIYYPVEPAFMSREQIVARCKQLTGIVAEMDKHNINACIAVLRTFYPTPGKTENIGFGQPRMDIDGKTHPNTPCPLDEKYLDYITFLYAEYAKTKTKAIIVDDDYRYEFISGLGPTCFCPLHVEEFNRRNSFGATFEELKKACESETASELKIAWMEFKQQLLVEFAVKLRETVEAVNPDCRVGLMLTCTEIALPDSRNVRQLVEAFAGDKQPLVRPGFGWYNDFKRIEFLQGAADAYLQTTQLPHNTDFQPEVDLYIHTGGFNKAVNTGLDFQIKANLIFNFKKINIWPFGSMDDDLPHHPFLKILQEKHAHFSAFANLIPDDAEITGIYTPFNPKAGYLRKQIKSALRMYGHDCPVTLWRLGMPFSFKSGDTVFLSKDAFPLSGRELSGYLDNYNVIIDGSALNEIAASDNCGMPDIEIGGIYQPGDCVYEKCLEHPVNGDLAGKTVIPVSWPRMAPVLPGKSWQPLTEILNNDGKYTGVSACIRESKGRRQAILTGSLNHGYFLNCWKQEFTQNLISWINGSPLPVIVKNAPDVCPVVLESVKQKVRIISLINASTAPHHGFAVQIPSNRVNPEISLISEAGKLLPVPEKNLVRNPDSIAILIDNGLPVLHSFHVLSFHIKD